MTGTPAPAPAPAAAAPTRRRYPEPVVALLVALVVAAAGAPLGLLWSAVAPRARFVMTQYGPATVESEPEQFVADDGWYVLLGLVFGLLSAVLVWWLVRRYRGPLVLVGLTLGAVLAGVLAWWLGHQIGLAQYRHLLAAAPVGRHFERPAEVRTKSVGLWFGVLPRVQGVVLVPAILAAAVYALLAGFHPEPELDRDDAAEQSPEPLPSPPADDLASHLPS